MCIDDKTLCSYYHGQPLFKMRHMYITQPWISRQTRHQEGSARVRGWS